MMIQMYIATYILIGIIAIYNDIFDSKYGKGEGSPLTAYHGYGIWECIHVFGEENVCL